MDTDKITERDKKISDKYILSKTINEERTVIVRVVISLKNNMIINKETKLVKQLDELSKKIYKF